MNCCILPEIKIQKNKTYRWSVNKTQKWNTKAKDIIDNCLS